MQTQEKKISILIAGGTGILGSFVTKHALTKPNLQVNILVRDPNKNKELVQQVESSGGRVIKGDLGDVNSLKDVTKDIHTVIPCIWSFDEKIYIDGQTALLNDALKNGVKRFFTSNFIFPTDKISKDEHSYWKNKKTFDEILSKAPISIVDIQPGFYLEYYFLYYQAEGFHYWGDIDQKIDLTTIEDIGRFTAAIAANENAVGTFVCPGNSLSTKEIAEIYNQVRGTNIKPYKKGSIEELKKLAHEAKSDPDMKSVIVTHTLVRYDGRAKLPDRFDIPDVKPTSLAEALQQNPALVLKEVTVSEK